MFRIPEYYQMPEMTFQQAQATFGGDLLKGMEQVSEHWDRYARGECDELYQDDDDFYETWVYEVNAYNTVYSTMKPLFS